MYIISLLLFCFSLINLFSITITDIISRQREFGLLRAVGLGKRKLKCMLYSEMAIQIFSEGIFSTIMGIFGGYLIVNNVFPKDVYVYRLPLQTIILLFLALLFIGFGVITIAIKCINKDAIVEQIEIIE